MKNDVPEQVNQLSDFVDGHLVPHGVPADPVPLELPSWSTRRPGGDLAFFELSDQAYPGLLPEHIRPR